jgi:hypothetical protein
MNRNFFDRISVHCWGGLGSQLFAWAFVEQLRLKYPKKRIQIVFHTSGVTKRIPEIGFLSPRFELIYTNDYSEKFSTSTSGLNWKFNLKSIFKKGLDSLRIINTSDRSASISQIMPWTISVRGHYSNVHIPKAIIQQMKLEMNKNHGKSIRINPEASNTLGIHYRLGDLLQLNNKSFISPQVIGPTITSVLTKENIYKTAVYSDSIDESKRYLQSYLPEDTEYVNSRIWETLLVLSANKYFIGSNSKISIWVILLQQSHELSFQSWIPKSMGKNINNKFYGTFNFENIHLY